MRPDDQNCDVLKIAKRMVKTNQGITGEHCIRNNDVLAVSKGSSIKYARKIFQKTNISNPLIRTRTCAFLGVRNVSFSENFAYILNR